MNSNAAQITVGHFLIGRAAAVNQAIGVFLSVNCSPVRSKHTNCFKGSLSEKEL